MNAKSLGHRPVGDVVAPRGEAPCTGASHVHGGGHAGVDPDVVGRQPEVRRPLETMDMEVNESWAHEPPRGVDHRGVPGVEVGTDGDDPVPPDTHVGDGVDGTRRIQHAAAADRDIERLCRRVDTVALVRSGRRHRGALASAVSIAHPGPRATPQHVTWTAVDVDAVVPGLDPVDPDVLDASAAADQPVGAGGQVVHSLEALVADGGRIECHEVGERPGLDDAALTQPEHLGRVRREVPHRLLEREDLPLAHPFLEQRGGEHRIADLAGMRASVGEPDDDAVVGEDAAERLDVVVAEHHQKRVLSPSASATSSIRSIGCRPTLAARSTRVVPSASSGWVELSATDTRRSCDAVGAAWSKPSLARARHAASSYR